MTDRILFRASQLLLVLVCTLREWVNVLTDIEQFQTVKATVHKIMTLPTPHNVHPLFDRAINAEWMTTVVASSWVIMHLLVASILTYGMVVLLRYLRYSQGLYHEKKLYACLGLALGIFSYIFLIGLMAMDYFLSWIQQINFNSDIAGYCLPLFISLFYLLVPDLSLQRRAET